VADSIPLAEGEYDRLPAWPATSPPQGHLIADFGPPLRARAAKARLDDPNRLQVGDPVCMSWPQSRRRGNLTGVSTMGPELIAKRLRATFRAGPPCCVIALLLNPNKF